MSNEKTANKVAAHNEKTKSETTKLKTTNRQHSVYSIAGKVRICRFISRNRLRYIQFTVGSNLVKQKNKEKMEKIAIIKGATSGIGKAIAKKIITEGHKVLAIGRDEEKLAILKNEHPNKCEIFKTDVSNRTDIETFFKKITSQYEQVEILINAAGFNKTVSTVMPFEEAFTNWESVLKTNLTGAFMMSVLAAPLLKKGKGHIINISSIGAFTGGSATGGIAYAAAKAGLNGLTFSLARELSPEGITVNSIAPSFIEKTGFTDVFPEEKVQQIIKNVLMNRAGNVLDIAELCFYLCSDKASYITGEIININGGWLFGR